MVRDSSNGVVKVKISLDARVHEKIEKLARESGLSVPKFIAETIEGLALDPSLRLLHDDPALAREIALKAFADYLDGKGVQVIASSVEEVELSEPEPGPEPEDNPVEAQALKLIEEIQDGLDKARVALGITGGGDGKGPESVNSEPPRKAMGRGRRSRAAPPRRN